MRRLALVALVALVATPTAYGTFPGRNGKLAFLSDRGEGAGVFTVSPDGRGLRRLSRPALHGSSVDFSPDGRMLAYASLGAIWIARADGTERRRLVALREDLVDPSPAWSPDSRHLAFEDRGAIHVIDVALGTRRRIVAPGGHPTWSADGRRIAYMNDTRRGHFGIYTVGLRHDPPRLVTEGAYPAWSRDGRWIAYVRSRNAVDDIYLVDPDGGETRRLTWGVYGRSAPAWSLDGRLAYLVFDYEGVNTWLYSVRPDGGERRRQGRIAEYEAEDPAWTSNARIAYTGGDHLRVLDPATGRSQRLLPGPAVVATAPNWLADGLLSFAGPRGLQVTDAAGSRPRVVPGRHTGPASWSPDGTHFTTGGVDVVDAATGKSTSILGDNGIGDYSKVARGWSPDGHWIAYLEVPTFDSELWLYRVADGRKRNLGVIVNGDVDWSPDARRVAYVYRSTIRVCDVATGGTRLLLRNASDPAWSPDGSLIAFSRGGDIWIAWSDGSRARRIRSPGLDYAPDWQPLR